jgi:hypothetical protein
LGAENMRRPGGSQMGRREGRLGAFPRCTEKCEVKHRGDWSCGEFVCGPQDRGKAK